MTPGSFKKRFQLKCLQEDEMNRLQKLSPLLRVLTTWGREKELEAQENLKTKLLFLSRKTIVQERNYGCFLPHAYFG